MSTLRYPPRPATPTLTYQLLIDYTLGSPRVAETPALGGPYEISKIILSSDKSIIARMLITLLVVTEPWITGEARSGRILHDVSGDDLDNDARHLTYFSTGPLVLRPRIRVNQAGTRLRLVSTAGGGGIPSLRVVVVLTPLD